MKHFFSVSCEGSSVFKINNLRNVTADYRVIIYSQAEYMLIKGGQKASL